MSFFPYTHLFLGPECTVAVAGPHIQVLDPSGNILHSTATDTDLNSQAVKSGAISCAAVDEEFKYLATSADDKIVRVWKVDGLRILSERVVPKKPTCIRITKRSQMIVVSDKFGDLYHFSLDPPSLPSFQAEKAINPSEENPSESNLLMGHASLLTTFIFTMDEKHIITADRDEHIRVSWYPESHVIERYCLGHLKYVTAIHIPSWEPSLLIAGGGDPALRLWDWMSGKQKHEIPISDAVMPFVKVKRAKGKGHVEDEELEGQGRGMSVRQRRKAKQETKSKQKGKNIDDEGVKEKMEEEKVEHTDLHEMDIDPVPGVGNVTTAELEAILVLRRIDTLEDGESRLLLFSAVGATALFYCEFPESSSAAPEIRSFDLGKPILEFVVNQRDGDVWILVDGQWNEDSSDLQPIDAIHVLRFVDKTFIRCTDVPRAQLLNYLNIKALIPSSPSDLKALDLYAWLSSMPKNVDAEKSHMIRDLSLVAGSEGNENENDAVDETQGEGVDEQQVAKGKKLSARQLGRMKRKKVLMEHIASSTVAQSDESRKGMGSRGTGNGLIEEVEQENAMDDVDTKRPRTDVE